MVSANGVINNKVGASISGVTNTLTVTNPSNTASSAARETITVGGGTAADPTLNFNVSGVTNWEMGIDNSVNDNLTISQGTALGTNDTWRMTTTGQRTLPLQTKFFAYVTATQTNVTGDGTLYTVIFDTESQDVGANYNNATGVFTAPATGTYLFSSTINYTNATTDGTSLNIDFNYNSGTLLYHGFSGGAKVISDPAGQASPSSSLILPMTAGDTISMTIAITGGPKMISIFGTTGVPGNNVSFFSGFLLG
jgi:hypothetical protein